VAAAQLDAFNCAALHLSEAEATDDHEIAHRGPQMH
jgi:hypothetical protein